MSYITPTQNVQIRIDYKDIRPDAGAIYPRIEIIFEIIYTRSGISTQTVILDNFALGLKLRTQGKLFFIGNLFAKRPYLEISASTPTSLQTFLDLDFYRLSQIEKLREGKNILFQVSGILYTTITQRKGKILSNINFNFEIPKSKWVENILSKVGFKDVSLLEIPKLPRNGYERVIKWVDSAWKQYMMGEYDKVLSDCRKALEGLTQIVKKKGFIKIAENKKKIPDWIKFFNNENLGDIFGSICQKMFGFMAVGAHFGKGINREDAELALMVTHSMTNFVIKKTPKE